MKRYTLGLVVWLVILILPTAAFGQSKATVDFWFFEHSQAFIDGIARIVDDFNQENPNYHVNLITPATSDIALLEHLSVAVAGNAAPDVVYLRGDGVREHGPALFQDLREWIHHQEIEVFDRNYFPGPRVEVLQGNAWYGVPFRSDTRGLYLNVDHFERAGLDSRSGPKDIPELDALAARLTILTGDGDIEQLGFAPNFNNFGDEMPWVWAFGGEIFDAESNQLVLAHRPENLEAVNWIHSYAERYGANTGASESGFATGRDSMHVNSTTRLSIFSEEYPELNWTVSEIPVAPGQERMSLGFTFAAAIPRGAKNPEGAAEFILHLAKPETQVAFYHATQALPTRLDVFQEILHSVTDPRVRTMYEHMPVTKVAPPLYNQLRVVWRTHLGKVRANELSPQAFLVPRPASKFRCQIIS